MGPQPPNQREASSSPRRATSPTGQTGRLLLAVWLATAIGLVGVGISWQILHALDGRLVELGVFLLWVAGLLGGARYLDVRHQ